MTMHRDNIAACPACGGGLEARGSRLVCGSCSGTLVTATELESMMKELDPQDQRGLAERLGEHDGALRGCPRCAAMMKSVALYGVGLEQCAEHGVWFDAKELAKVLEASGEEYASQHEKKVRTWAAMDLATGGPIDVILGWMFDRKRSPKRAD